MEELRIRPGLRVVQIQKTCEIWSCEFLSRETQERTCEIWRGSLKDLNEIVPLRPKTHPHVKVYIEKPKQEHKVKLHPLGPQN